MMRLLLTTVVALLAVLSSRAGPVEAKTPGYILTGGDLGEYAVHIFVESYLDHSDWYGKVTKAQAPKAIPSGPVYSLFTTMPFEAARQLEQDRPDALYYPSAGLTYSFWEEAWLRPEDGLLRAVDEAIARAEASVEAGDLSDGVVLASLRGRGYDRAIYNVWPSQGEPYRIFTANFPLAEFAAALSGPSHLLMPPAGPDELAYRIDANVPEVSPYGMRYWPPAPGRPGFLASAESGAEERYWPSTPEFDRLFAEAKRQPLFTYGQSSGPADASGTLQSYDSGSFLARTVSLLLVPLIVVVALGGLGRPGDEPAPWPSREAVAVGLGRDHP